MSQAEDTLAPKKTRSTNRLCQTTLFLALEDNGDIDRWRGKYVLMFLVGLLVANDAETKALTLPDVCVSKCRLIGCKQLEPFGRLELRRFFFSPVGELWHTLLLVSLRNFIV